MARVRIIIETDARHNEPTREGRFSLDDIRDRVRDAVGSEHNVVGVTTRYGAALRNPNIEGMEIEERARQDAREKGQESDDVVPQSEELEGDIGEPVELEPAEEGEEGEDGPDATDAARQLAEENDVDLSEVEGTGADGRITVGDVKNAISAEQAEE